MPFNARKRYTKFRGLPTFKKVLSVASTARTALSIASSLASLINTEFKFVDSQTSAAAVATPATTLFIHNFFAMQQGSDEQNRIGNSILPKGLSVRLEFSGNPSGGTDQDVRYLILIDRDQNGTPPLITEVLQISTQQDSFLNMDNRKRFRVLADVKLKLGNASTTTQYPRTKHREHYFKFNKKVNPKYARSKRKWYHILYSNTTAADASMDNGQIYIMAWSNEVTNSPTCRITARGRYIDN